MGSVLSRPPPEPSSMSSKTMMLIAWAPAIATTILILRADVERREAERRARQAEEERRRGEERAQIAVAALARANHEVQEARQQQMQANQERQRAERVAAAAEARTAGYDAQRILCDRLQQYFVPSKEHYVAMKQRLQYRGGMFHFAVVKVSGSGISSLINALRGLGDHDLGAAPTGVVKATKETTRYPDARAELPFVWYDVPGASTSNVPQLQYFMDQGLYAFDCVVVVFDSRFTESDIAILRHCNHFDIPAYIVRSKSRQHIRNLAEDRGDPEDAQVWATARKECIRQTGESVAQNLAHAGLNSKGRKQVYMVDRQDVMQIVRGGKPANLIDEKSFLDAVADEAHRRFPLPVVSFLKTDVIAGTAAGAWDSNIYADVERIASGGSLMYISTWTFQLRPPYAPCWGVRR